MEDRKSTIDQLCKWIPSFDKYIRAYFPELVSINDNRKAVK